MYNNWLVILPPLVVVGSVLLTRRMILSFILGIITSVLIATDLSLTNSASLMAKRLWENTGLSNLTSISGLASSWSLCIFIFLISLGIIITLLQHTGAANAYTRVAQRTVKNRQSTEVASLILSFLFFIDDYFSALTVGSVMRPLANLYKLHPVKLAFLVTAMATPITILSPISSWVGEIVLQLKQSGVDSASGSIINADPYSIFLRTIPFLIYPILLIISTWYIVLRNISYGPMTKYDNYQGTYESKVQASTSADASIFDFLFPILMLIASVFIGLLYTGNFYLFGGDNGFFQALRQSAVHQAFLFSGIFSVVSSCIFFVLRKRLNFQSLAASLKEGVMLMLPSILMLICAWTLGSILKQDLQTGNYIASIFSILINDAFFPLICFIFSALICWMIGSAWATIGLMFPIIIPMLQAILGLKANIALETIPLLLPVIGASISGAILGTHISLIADNPIMAATSTGANHLEHVKTMAWYIFPVVIAASIAYAIIGLFLNKLGLLNSTITAIICSIVVSILLLELAQRMFGKNHK